MKRSLSSALILGLLVSPVIGLVGCGQESKVEKVETVSGPGGTTTTSSEVKVESTGENPPPNSAGQTVK
ncbi:hypothetical protein V5E97_17985 [Singulisphaera sp. Ch08]|uniref:Uncharacterized protein n=1 Tax=Singulisphaera sp. Ch08 TaxID=3120278 RepID=A0AAU7CT50_9BACT